MKKYGKFLSLILRHQPHLIGVTLDSAGWTDVGILIKAVGTKYPEFTWELLQQIVKTDDKQRFEFDKRGVNMRASQGHSVTVDLQLESQQPPDSLYHGTSDKNLTLIMQSGVIHAGSRHAVQLSEDVETAFKVGKRHGDPVVLHILAGSMYKFRHKFTKSTNGVWLTHSVDTAYIEEVIRKPLTSE